jgi:hypothetical protein
VGPEVAAPAVAADGPAAGVDCTHGGDELGQILGGQLAGGGRLGFQEAPRRLDARRFQRKPGGEAVADAEDRVDRT